MTILDEAREVIFSRQTQYGTREQNFTDIARMWSVILRTEITYPPAKAGGFQAPLGGFAVTGCNTVGTAYGGVIPGNQPTGSLFNRGHPLTDGQGVGSFTSLGGTIRHNNDWT